MLCTEALILYNKRHRGRACLGSLYALELLSCKRRGQIETTWGDSMSQVPCYGKHGCIGELGEGVVGGHSHVCARKRYACMHLFRVGILSQIVAGFLVIVLLSL